jgi:hypothetical protein
LLKLVGVGSDCDPACAIELFSIDVNGKLTTAAYDPLGRRISVGLGIGLLSS